MNRRLRHLTAVVILATALCADRAIAAAPALRPAVGDIAATFVQRLARNLSRVTRPAAFRTDHRTREQAVSPAVAEPITPIGLHGVATPYQFRLPPPAAR